MKNITEEVILFSLVYLGTKEEAVQFASQSQQRKLSYMSLNSKTIKS